MLREIVEGNTLNFQVGDLILMKTSVEYFTGKRRKDRPEPARVIKVMSGGYDLNNFKFLKKDEEKLWVKVGVK